MRKRGMRFRMVLSYSLLIVLAVGLFLAALVNVTDRTGLEVERANQEELVASYARRVGNIIKGMDAVAQQVTSNAQFINYFVPLAGDGDMSNFFSTHVLESIEASSLLATINTPAVRAARISAYNWMGDYVSTGMLYETDERVAETLADAERPREMLRTIRQSPDHMAVWGPIRDPWSTSEKNLLFAVVRPLANAYGSNVYALVSVQKDVSTLEDLGLFAADGPVATLLLDAEGEVVLPRGAEKPDWGVPKGQVAEDGATATAFYQAEGREMVAIGAPVEAAGWTVVRTQPLATLLSPYRGTKIAILLGGAALLLVLIGLVAWMADRIARPLERFSASMRRVNLRDMEAPLLTGRDFTMPELQTLHESFQSMLHRLNESMDLELTAYQYALQSQMNPHFLYNTLAVVSASAQEAGNERVAVMCERLSGMLRYTLGNGGGGATLAEELKHTASYLELMKLRYEDGFSYEITGFPGCEDMRVPKLLLQPLVENCFQHGFRDVRPPWRVRVAVERAGTGWLLTVADNGRGMTEAEIAALRARVEETRAHLADAYPALKLGGLGLVNTILRLTLAQSGARYEFARPSAGGTEIRIWGGVEA